MYMEYHGGTKGKFTKYLNRNLHVCLNYSSPFYFGEAEYMSGLVCCLSITIEDLNMHYTFIPILLRSSCSGSTKTTQ